MKDRNSNRAVARRRMDAAARSSRGTAAIGGFGNAAAGVAAALLFAAMPAASAATIDEVTNFGSNPGQLKMFKYIPEGLPASAPLVVVMHGCKQNARDFAGEAGWTHIADTSHVALVMPE